MGAVSWVLLIIVAFILPVTAEAGNVVDGSGRSVNVPDRVEHVICSGPGCLRLLTYLRAGDMVVGVDDIEGRRRALDARPYALAHPEYKSKQVFGEFRGHDNPELILNLEPQPQVIFKTYADMGYNPDELSAKTGIPVISLDYGNLTDRRESLYDSLRIMGNVTGKQARAEDVITFFEQTIAELQQRVTSYDTRKHPSVFLGGVAHKGPHGFQSTEPAYPPFVFLGVRHLALSAIAQKNQMTHSVIAKEQIVAWDPDILFLDLATIQLGEKGSGLYELQHDPAYQTMQAVQESKVYGVLPYNWYTMNYGSILADAYFIGTVLYPDAFSDVSPRHKADEVYAFLVGKPVYEEMNSLFAGMAFRRITLK